MITSETDCKDLCNTSFPSFTPCITLSVFMSAHLSLSLLVHILWAVRNDRMMGRLFIIYYHLACCFFYVKGTIIICNLSGNSGRPRPNYEHSKDIIQEFIYN